MEKGSFVMQRFSTSGSNAFLPYIDFIRGISVKDKEANSQIYKLQGSNKVSQTKNKPVHSARKFSDVLGATSGKS